MITRSKLLALLEVLKEEYRNSTVVDKQTHLIFHIPEGEGIDLLFHFNDPAHPRCETLYRNKGDVYTFSYPDGTDGLIIESLDTIPVQVVEQVVKIRELQMHPDRSQLFDLGPITIYVTPESKRDLVATLKHGGELDISGSVSAKHKFSLDPQTSSTKASFDLIALVGSQVYVSSIETD